MTSDKTLCYKRSDLPTSWLKEKIAIPFNLDQFIQKLNKTTFHFEPRNIIEYDESYKQLIPYILVTNNEGKILSYQRKGTESRLHGLWSVGVGGHIDEEDQAINDLKETIIKGTSRELLEELNIKNPFENTGFKCLGIINEEKTKTGRTHLGLVFNCQISENTNLIYEKELHNPTWLPLEEIQDNTKYIKELWSILALELPQNQEIK